MPTSQDSRQGSPDSVSVLVPGSHPDLVLLTGIDDDELTHHPFVLVQEHMAVVHIRQVRVGVVLAAHEESVDAIRFEVDRVLAPAPRHRRGLAADAHLIARAHARLGAAPVVAVLRLLALGVLGELGDLALERGSLPWLGWSIGPYPLRSLIEEPCGLPTEWVGLLRGSPASGCG